MPRRPDKGWLILLALSALLAGCGQKEATSEPVDGEVGRVPSQEMWQSRIIVTQAGHKQAILDYGHMVQYEGDKVSYFDQGVKVDFFNRDGAHASVLTAERGQYHQETEAVVGQGNVVVVSDSGYVMRTERLNYDATKETIFSDTLVMVVSPESDTLWSVGFESKADLSHRIFYRPRIAFNRHVDLGQAAQEPARADSSRQAPERP